jgi:DNA polymerase III epsilon subunit-like protein
VTVFWPEGDALRALMRRPFVVIDVETTWVPEGGPQRLVSYAYVSVRGGVIRTDKSDTSLVNPGVPIAAKSSETHHIYDHQVKDLAGFDAHVDKLERVLSEPGVVFVAHNVSFDAAVLRNEFALLGRAIPDVPVLDTMWLPKTLGYAKDGLGPKPALPLLAAALGVAFTKADHHDANLDATATANILIHLLTDAATNGRAVSIEQLLILHDRGTTRTVSGTGYISSRDADYGYHLDADHLALHTEQPPPTGKVQAPWIDAWLARAEECATLLCPLLLEETQAIHLDTGLLFGPLHRNIAALTQPGQLATLIGATMRALRPDQNPRQEITWWRKHEKAIQAAPPCAGPLSCPDCRQGNPCPLDVAHEYAAASLMKDATGKATQERQDALLATNGPIEKWVNAKPVDGHVAWLVYRDQVIAREPQRAAQTLELARSLGLHKVEPQLAVRVAYKLVGQGRSEEALDLLSSLLRPASTNTARAAVTQAHTKIQALREQEAARSLKPPRASIPGRTRPDARTRPNPYRP